MNDEKVIAVACGSGKIISIDQSNNPDISVVNGVIQVIHVDEIQAHIHLMTNATFDNPLSEFELNYCLKKPSIFLKSIEFQKPSKKPYKQRRKHKNKK